MHGAHSITGRSRRGEVHPPAPHPAAAARGTRALRGHNRTSRDPAGEFHRRDKDFARHSPSLLAFVTNDAVQGSDYLGLWNILEGALGELIDRIFNDGVYWDPAPCPLSLERRFIQVFWANSTPRETGGRVDTPGTGHGKVGGLLLYQGPECAILSSGTGDRHVQ